MKLIYSPQSARKQSGILKNAFNREDSLLIGRERERQELRRRYERRKAEFIVISDPFCRRHLWPGSSFIFKKSHWFSHIYFYLL